MLFYRWNLTSVNSPELQHALLSSGLVNWTGAPNTYKPIDLGLEHLNCSCKIEMKCYKNSTHDTDVIFNRVCLSNATVRTLRGKMEHTFGEEMPGAHTHASVELDMFLLAYTLYSSDLAAPRNPGQLVGLQLFDSHDIFRTGVDVLAERVTQFNELHVQDPHSVAASYPLPDADDLTGFADIQDYADVVGDGLEEVDLTTG
jgi:hypothetical protein